MKRIGHLLLASMAWATCNTVADVARIGATTYPTLHAAVAAAPSDATIELIGDAILTNVLSISRPVSIVSDGTVRRIARTNAFADDVISIQAPGALVLGSAMGSDSAPTLILDGGGTNSIVGGFSFIFAYNAGVVVHPGVVLRNFRGLYAPLYGLDETGLTALVLNGGTFSGNATTNSSGGALCSQGMAVFARNATFASNTALRGRGGAIYLEDTALIATNLVIRDNAADDYGGGIMGFPGSVVLYGGTVSGNTALNGGGIANGHGNLTLDGTLLSDNQAFYGAGIWSHTGVNDLQSTTFRNNHADIFGGALYSTSSGYSISNCQIVANTADSYGGGIYLSPSVDPHSAVDIDASTISSNSGLNGGGIYSSHADLAIAGSTLLDNRATGPGGACWLFGDTTIRDTRIANNVSSNEGGGIFHLGGPLALSGQTQLEGNVGTTGNGIWCYNTLYEGSNAVLSLSDSISLASADDIVLHTNVNTILLDGMLVAPGTVATITPPVYSNGLPLLRDSAGLPFSPVSRYYAKFAVTPQPTSPTNWYIGTNGTLTFTAPPSAPVPPLDLREMSASASAGAAFRFGVDPELLEYAFGLQAAAEVVDGAWNFQPLLDGYVVTTNGDFVLDADVPQRVYRLVFP